MKPETHPNEPLLEAILTNQDSNAKDTHQLLEEILVSGNESNTEALLELNAVQNDDILKELQKKPEVQQVKIVTDESELADNFFRMLRGQKGEKGDKGDSIKGEKGDKGEDSTVAGPAGKDGKDGLNGKDGKDGRDGLDGRDGIDGKDGKDGKQGPVGPKGKDGKSISKEDIDRIASGLNKTKKADFLFANSGVNEIVAGSNITIDNTNPQNPIISATSGGTGTVDTVVAGTGISVDSTDPANPIVTNSAPDQTVSITAGTNITSVTGTYPNFTINAATQAGGTGDVVGPASAVDSNFAAFDTTTGKLIKDSGSKASDFAAALTSDQNYVSDAQLVVLGNTSGTNTGDDKTAATGILKGNGTTISAATSGTDYLAPVMTTLGDTVYGGASGVQTRLGGNTSTSPKFLTSIGDGSLATAPYWDIIPAVGNLTYYLSDVASDVATYYKQTSAPVTADTFVASGLATGTTLIGNLITEPNMPGVTFIPAGQYDVELIVALTAGTRQMATYAEIWEADADGVDIALIGTTTQSGIISSKTSYKLDFVTSAPYTLASATSRIVTRVYAVEIVPGSNATLTYYFGGTDNSRMTLPYTVVSANTFVPYTGATSDVDLGTKNFATTGSIGVTGSRVLKGWFTDLEVTNAIAGSITGNAGGSSASCTGNAATATLATTATDTASKTGTGSTYVTNTSPTLVTPALGTPTTLTLTNATGLPAAGVTGTAMTLSSADTVTGVKTLGTTGALKLGSAVTDTCEIRLNNSALNDETWSGTVIEATAGATLAVGDVCYLASSGKWVLNDGILDGTDTGFKSKLGICVLAGADTEPTKILLDGVVASAAFPAFTVGAPVYLSDTEGDLVVAQPSTTNFAIRIVGEAISATVLHFSPSRDYIVHV